MDSRRRDLLHLMLSRANHLDALEDATDAGDLSFLGQSQASHMVVRQLT